MSVLRDLSATDLAAAIRDRSCTSVEAVQVNIDALHELHSTTNCVLAFDDERALARADQLDRLIARGGPVGPLHGVPVTVKDWIDVEGLPCTGGAKAQADRRPDADATVVARLREAGAVVMAKTAIAQSEMSPLVRNPHDPSRSPGGSSSGEAVAVAAHASPLGFGSDSGGSIRLPAAWCGVAGLKPTTGRVPVTGHFPRVGERSDGRTVIGSLARTVADLALALRVIEGPDGADPWTHPAPAAQRDVVDVRDMRVSWFASEPGWVPSKEIVACVQAAARSLEVRGASLRDGPPPHLDESLDITKRYWGRRGLSGEEAVKQLWDWDRFRRRMLVWAAEVDVLVMPATLEPAPLERPIDERDYIFTLPASLTGWPAVTVPAGTHDGLPLSVQVVAKPWEDDVALAVAVAIEADV